VESGEGIERTRNANSKSGKRAWNPVKELKDYTVAAGDFAVIEWNPVKELKVHLALLNPFVGEELVESGEGIES